MSIVDIEKILDLLNPSNIKYLFQFNSFSAALDIEAEGTAFYVFAMTSCYPISLFLGIYYFFKTLLKH